MQTLEIEPPGQGRTVLGRKVALTPRITFWRCPHCKKPQVLKLDLPLDPDAPLVRAYEQRFGQPDESALAALAKLNADFLRHFGEDWQRQFGGAGKVQAIVQMAVQKFKDQCGDDWATQMVQADWEFINDGGDTDV
jgi:hypothetical protein